MREYIKAFEILNQTRQYGMGPNPIQLSEILAYLKLYGTDDQPAFIEYILKMDAASLTVKAQQAERKREAEKKRDGRNESGGRQ